MTPEQFVYWLKGFKDFEDKILGEPINNPQGIITIIFDELKKVISN